MRIYFPMTANILTPGHIRCLRFLSKLGYVYVGLLTKEALKGYKREVVPFKDRKEILDTIADAVGGIAVVPQKSLNPKQNIRKYKCQALASGDGFEPVEKKAAKGLKLINIKFKNEKSKKYSSSKICQSTFC